MDTHIGQNLSYRRIAETTVQLYVRIGRNDVCVECRLVDDGRGGSAWDVDLEALRSSLEDAASDERSRLAVDDAAE
jgi:hypothetical protein